MIEPKIVPPQTDEDWQYRIYDALEAFSPGAPIDDLNLLAGRTKQIDRMLDAVVQRGQHAILYGERGVGKSSLANTFSTKLLGRTKTIAAVSVNCDPSDDYTRIWKKVFRRLSDGGETLAERYPGEIYPDDVVLALSDFSLNTIAIIVLDEFDKIEDDDARTLMANTIKSLSDHPARFTLILVGVADAVTDLIEEHESISRCLKQIQMPRMFPSELRQILEVRLPRLGMDIHQDATASIVAISRGLPHFTHLLGQRAAKAALLARSLTINIEHVTAALPDCISETAQSIREQYHKATISPRQGNIYSEVLLAAALAQVDDLGYFAPADLKKPLSELLGREAPVSLFGQHLKKLCEDERGCILEQVGSERRYRYRFVEPMMQPYILINGLRGNRITQEQVNQLAATHYEPRLSSDF